LFIILGVLLFVGFIVYGTAGRAAVNCEVCLEFEGELVCRKGAGGTEAEAMQAAQESTCGGNTSGMSEFSACRNRVPERTQCQAG
jgi:hypothetical protein